MQTKAEYDPFSRGPFAVGVRTFSLTDASRDRTLPLLHQVVADQAATLKKELRAARRQVGQIKQEMSRFQHRSSREIEALRDTLTLKNKELKQVNDKLQRFLKLFTNLEDMSMSLMDACET